MDHPPGVNDVNLKIFSPKNLEKIGVFNKTLLIYAKTITLVFKKNANMFAQNCRKSLKVVIITSTQGPAEQINTQINILT
jgi:hypothetical protein